MKLYKGQAEVVSYRLTAADGKRTIHEITLKKHENGYCYFV